LNKQEAHSSKPLGFEQVILIVIINRVDESNVEERSPRIAAVMERSVPLDCGSRERLNRFFALYSMSKKSTSTTPATI
jgi:hypothetical protein